MTNFCFWKKVARTAQRTNHAKHIRNRHHFRNARSETAARFYVEQFGFEITGEAPNMISLHGPNINLFIERGRTLGPVFEVSVGDVEAAKARLTQNGCKIVKDEPVFSKKIENHVYAFALYTMYHNFVKMSGPHRMTPAMKAGVDKRLWEMEISSRLVEAWEASSTANLSLPAY